MDHPEIDSPPLASEDQPSPDDSSLPHLLYSLELATPTLVLSDSLPVHHEEVVDVPELLPEPDDGTQEQPALSLEVPEPPPGAADGTQESPVLSVECLGVNDGTQAHPALSVEVPSLIAEIDDMPNAVWFVDDDLAVIQNGHSNANHQFLNLVANSAPASSDESIYFDAETGAVEPPVFEPGVVPMGRNDHVASLAHVDMPEEAPAGAGQLEMNDPVSELAHVDLPEEAPAGAGQLEMNDPVAELAHVDLPADAPASPENVASPRDRAIVPVSELENLPPAIPPVPLALPEEDDDPLVFDPLEASPLLDSLGFSRVQRAYDRWLQNMSHSISIFQGIYFQA